MEQSNRVAFRGDSKKIHPGRVSDLPMRAGEFGGEDNKTNPSEETVARPDKRPTSLTISILDHFKRNLSSASLKSNKSSSASLNKHADEVKTSSLSPGSVHGDVGGDAKEASPMRTRKTGCVDHGGIVNRGFVDDKNNQPFAILRERSDKKGTKPKWQKQLSSYHSEIYHQKFNEQQKRTLRAYSSANYMPAHSITYVRWMKIHRASWISRFEIDRWFLITLIGVIIGLVTTLLRQCITLINKGQWITGRAIIKNDLWAGYWYLAGTNALMVLGGAIIVTLFHPMAAGGGAPEVIAFLNGIRVHGTLSVKNLLAKFSANVLAVASGLPAAVQGPLITYGAIIGAGIGQFQSKPFRFSPNIFRRFRNAEDRRTFTTDGVAAGVSAGFHAPIGGVLFAMEDLSSFWSKGLSWQTFFCSVVATSTAQMFNAAFNGFAFANPHEKSFGFFFWSTVPSIQLHVIMFLPSILLGIMGGLLGALFTRVNVFINSQRKFLLSKIKHVRIQQIIKMLEPCVIVILMTAFTVFLPLAIPCKPIHTVTQTYIPSNITKSPFDLIKFQSYRNCQNNGSIDEFNPLASLIQGGSQSYLDALWSRNTFYVFNHTTCLCAFAIYFPLTIWTAGSAIAGGIFVPILISGSLLGRALGVSFVEAFRMATGRAIPSVILAWTDPGVMAAVGAGALLSGVNRLEVASTVILVEMVGDINLVLPVLVAIFVSKTIASKLSKPLYKYQLEGKALPFLDTEPELVVHGKLLNMELWRARDIMASPVHTIPINVSVNKVSKLLLDTKHNGFPVVKYDDDARFEVVYGMITRHELYSILSNEEVYRVYHENTSPEAIIDPKIPYEDMDTDGSPSMDRTLEMLRSYTMKKEINTKINLELYVNMSLTKVDQNYSLMRTYRLFRTMGLRQLLVADNRNRPVGMITRKDLMQFNMQERLEKLIGLEIPEDGGGGIPRVYSGNQLAGGRRMSRRFSVEEGSVLGVVVAKNEAGDGDADSKDEAVIELPAVTRIRKMETIREEENSSSTDADQSLNEENQGEGHSDVSTDQERKTSFTVVKIEELDDGNGGDDDGVENNNTKTEDEKNIVQQHPHLEKLYQAALKQKDKSTQRF